MCLSQGFLTFPKGRCPLLEKKFYYMMLCAMLGWNLISVSGGDDENVKSVQHVTEDGQRTNFDQLTWALNWSVLKINQNITYSSVIMEENATCTL